MIKKNDLIYKKLILNEIISIILSNYWILFSLFYYQLNSIFYKFNSSATNSFQQYISNIYFYL
jgi:hypothetical protein